MFWESRSLFAVSCRHEAPGAMLTTIQELSFLRLIYPRVSANIIREAQQ